MNTQRACLTILLSMAAAAASAAPGVPLNECVALSPDHEIVRAGSGQSFLLRDGEAHYRVDLRGSCRSLTTTPRLTIASDDTAGLLCPAGSRVRTDRETCPVEQVEAIDAEAFASGKRRARR